MKTAIDRLIDRIKEMNNPTVIGLDPRYDMLPDCIKNKYGTDLRDVCRAIIEYNYKLIDSVCDIIPAVKPQIAFYEMFGAYGIEAFYETCRYAKNKGMIVIADMKRGDIGTTAQAYSNASIGKTKISDMDYSIYDIDFVTVNPYLGTDGIKPFIEDCKKYNKGIFILVKTSNKSSGELQDLKLENGKTVYEKVAELVNSWGEDTVGKYGYNSISAVVGATYPKQLEELRKIMPTSYFLIPGYGAQGGKAEDIALGFDKNGLGGIVNASRSLMCAWKSDRWKDKYTDEQFAEATRAEAIRMRDELNEAIKGKNDKKMDKRKFKLECEIIKTEKIIDGIYHFTIKAPEIANVAKAGQFLEIQVSKTGEVFLRRPISIYNINKENGEVEFIFQVKGKGTMLLSKCKVGDTINVLGPLGNGVFSVKKYDKVAIIGGGIGTYPLYELAKELKEKQCLDVTMYMGFRNKELVTLEKEFEEITDSLVITTDDGSYKEKGLALDVLKEDCLKEKPDIIFACGPLPMLKAVQHFANENDIECEMSLEERMGCGIYACVGCNVRIVTENPDEVKYKYVCTNGPVFNSKEVII